MAGMTSEAPQDREPTGQRPPHLEGVGARPQAAQAASGGTAGTRAFLYFKTWKRKLEFCHRGQAGACAELGRGAGFPAAGRAQAGLKPAPGQACSGVDEASPVSSCLGAQRGVRRRDEGAKRGRATSPLWHEMSPEITTYPLVKETHWVAKGTSPRSPVPLLETPTPTSCPSLTAEVRPRDRPRATCAIFRKKRIPRGGVMESSFGACRWGEACCWGGGGSGRKVGHEHSLPSFGGWKSGKPSLC